MKIQIIRDYQFSKKIYNLNNSSSVRNNSINKKKFKYKDHLIWFNKLINSKNKNGYLIFANKKLVGFIKTFKYKNYVNISWSVFKNMRSKGNGKKMLKLFTTKFPNKYKAKIIKSNNPSIKVCLYANFEIYLKRKNIFYFRNYR